MEENTCVLWGGVGRGVVWHWEKFFTFLPEELKFLLAWYSAFRQKYHIQQEFISQTLINIRIFHQFKWAYLRLFQMTSSRYSFILKYTNSQTVQSSCTQSHIEIIIISHFSNQGRIKLRRSRCIYFNLFMLLSPRKGTLVWVIQIGLNA